MLVHVLCSPIMSIPESCSWLKESSVSLFDSGNSAIGMSNLSTDLLLLFMIGSVRKERIS